jgi:hypothetical protein
MTRDLNDLCRSINELILIRRKFDEASRDLEKNNEWYSCMLRAQSYGQLMLNLPAKNKLRKMSVVHNETELDILFEACVRYPNESVEKAIFLLAENVKSSSKE